MRNERLFRATNIKGLVEFIQATKDNDMVKVLSATNIPKEDMSTIARFITKLSPHLIRNILTEIKEDK